MYLYLFFKKIMGPTKHVDVGPHEFTVCNTIYVKQQDKLNGIKLKIHLKYGYKEKK